MNLRAAFIVLFALIGSLNNLPACGDKFLVAGRGTRYQRPPIARESAAILIYSHPTSEVPKKLAGIPIEGALRKAGYRPTVVVSSVDFEKALGRGGWDVVLVGIGDAPSASRRVQGNSVVLPVVASAMETEWKQAKKLYPVVLKSSAKSQLFLEALDDALASRPKVHANLRKAAI